MLYRLFALFTTLVLLAACGGAPAAPQATEPTTVPAAASAAPNNAAPTEAAATATTAPLATPAQETAVATRQFPGFPPFAPPPTMLDVVEDRDDTVLVKHQFGEVEIPKNPQRIYADPSDLSTALLLDLNVVGGDYFGDLKDLPNFEELVKGIDVVEATGYEANFERIALLQPDLILATSYVLYGPTNNPAGVYEKLSQIAPTIVFNDDPWTHWQQAALDLANALELDVALEATFARFQAEVDTACAPLKAAIGDQSVMLVVLVGGTDTTIAVTSVGYLNEREDAFLYAADSRWLYDYCELQPPLNLADFVPVAANGGGAEISAELIPTITADHIFVTAFEMDQADAEAVLKNPLWQSVPAVQQGNVYMRPATSAYSYDTVLNTIRLASEAVEATNTPRN